LAVYSKFVNIRNNANLDGPAYNMQEWGQTSASSAAYVFHARKQCMARDATSVRGPWTG
jgi:hypothetical protein